MKLLFKIKLTIQFIFILTSVFMLTSCEQQADNPATGAEPFLVKCEVPIPDFTLGYDSDPSEEEVSTLCNCIWEKLGDWEKETAKAIFEGRESDVSALNMHAFPSRFGGAIEKCGGMNM